jgi:AmmeMemoRadiSam system protein A
MSLKHGICAGFLLPHPPIAVPAVGAGREKEAAATVASYKIAAHNALSLEPETVVVISPHAPLFSDYVFMYDSPVLEGSFEQFGVNDIHLSFEQDSELRKEIENLMRRDGIPGGSLSKASKLRHNISDELDHGVLVPLYYFSSEYKNFKLVAMSCSGLDMQKLYHLGRLINEASENIKRRVCIIASGDMSHKANANSPYGVCPEGAQFDSLVADNIRRADLPGLLSIDSTLRERAAECGYRSLVILIGAFDGKKVKTELLSSEAPFGIGYCAAKFLPTDEPADCAFEAAYPIKKRKNTNPYTAIARAALESYVKTGTVLSKDDFSSYKDEKELFDKKAGVFVSLKKFGELRGCIGTTQPCEECVASEIIRNAISAGTRDPRFEPVSKDEIDYLEYSVDVLSEPVPAKTAELNPKRFGVLVSNGTRSGLLLPDLEGVDTVEKQLSIACKKAGIGIYEDFKIYKFTVTRHKEDD